MKVTGRTKRNAAIAAPLLAVLAIPNAHADVSGCTAAATMNSDRMTIYVPGDEAPFPLGRVEEGDTRTEGSLSCGEVKPDLGMRLRTYLLLPGGPNYTACLAAAETTLLGALLLPSCGTIDQSAIGSILEFPWRGVPTATNANAGNQRVQSCADCQELAAAKTMSKLSTTSNGNVALALALALGTLQNNGLSTPPASTFTGLVAPATPPGIYHVEAAFGTRPCGAGLTAEHCDTANTAFNLGVACPTTNAGCAAAGIAPAAGVCPLSTALCTAAAAAWADDAWVEQTLYGEFVVTGQGAEVCLQNQNPDPEDPAGGLTCAPVDVAPVALPTCDGTTASEDQCLTKLLPALPEIPECFDNPNDPEGEPICVPSGPPFCVENPADPGGEPICLPPDLGEECVEDPNDPNGEICPPEEPPAGSICVDVPFLGPVGLCG